MTISTAFSQGRSTKKADMLFEAGYPKLAIEEYEAYQKQNSSDFHSALRLTKCYLDLGDLKFSKNWMAVAEKNMKAETIEYYGVKAELLHKQHEFAKAIDFYKKSDPAKTNFRVTSKKITECENGAKFIKKPIDVKITNLGPNVNSPQHDYLPQITADFLQLYFSSQRKGATGNLGNPEDIYLTTFTGAGWAPPIRLDPPINSDENETCIGLSPDGQMMFIFKGTNGGDIYISELDGKKWSKPEAFPYNTENKESSMCISPDGKMLYFVRKPLVGGNANIYQCAKNSLGNWSKPVLVKGLNTEYDEESPYIHPDGKTLYFSSKGHSSMGGYDIFKSELVNNQWSTPQNLGYPINTANDDFTFVLSASGQFGFYSSVREGGEGGLDLYMLTMPLPERNKQVALLKGKVESGIDGKPTAASITIIDNDKNEEVGTFKSNAETGEYLIPLPAGKNYGIRVEKNGHLFQSENVYLPAGSTYKTVEKKISLVPNKPGAKIILNNIFFESGKFELMPSSFAELDRLQSILSANTSIRIEISGHTDNVGAETINISLSEKRALEVKNYLVSKGISSNRIEIKGLGSSQPIADNKTEDGRQRNRRTEMKIIP